jgi:RNA polymerase sigma-70 factor (ECF subfamily)
MTLPSLPPPPSSCGGELIADLLRRARAVWPEVKLDAEVFAAYLESRLPPGLHLAEALGRMRTDDLYLACACSRGDAQAIVAFEERCLGVVDETLPRIPGVNSDIVDDVKQELRWRLLVADGGPPRIVEFWGRGDLRRWVRVMAVREALAMTRRARRETPSEDQLLERALVPAQDQEMEYLKRLYRNEFTAAIGEALRGLSPREQTLLRQSFVDGLSIDELGALHGVHRATAARWLARAQSSMSRKVQAVLMHNLHVRTAELRSILRFIRSGLQVSLRLVFPGRKRRRKAVLARQPRPL